MSEIIRTEALVVVKPGEDIVASLAGSLREDMKGVIGSGARDVVLDLSGVEMIDSVGLGVLIATYNTLERVGGGISIINATRDILDLFSNMRLDRYFKIVAS